MPGLQLVGAFLEDGEVTEQETESIVASAFRAVLVAGIMTGLVIAFNKMQAEIRRGSARA